MHLRTIVLGMTSNIIVVIQNGKSYNWKWITEICVKYNCQPSVLTSQVYTIVTEIVPIAL